MDRKGNLKPAPFALTPALVGKIVHASPLPAKGVAQIPLERIALGEPRATADSGDRA